MFVLQAFTAAMIAGFGFIWGVRIGSDTFDMVEAWIKRGARWAILTLSRGRR